MMFSTAIIASSLLLIAGAMGQTNPAGTGSNSGPDGNMVNVQVVQVGNMNGDLKFNPEEIKAEAGSMVQFQFYPKSHTVTQSPFTNPCEPINKIMPNVTGINSGPMPPENGMMKVFTIMINDTKPIWMYCATADHCQKGMVMAINAPAEGERTLATYKAAAAKAAVKSSNSSTNGSSTSDATGAAAAPTPTGAASSIVNSMAGTTGVATFLVAAFALLL